METTEQYYIVNIDRIAQLPMGPEYEAYIMQSLEEALMAYQAKHGKPPRYIYRLPVKMAGRFPPLWMRVEA